MPAYEQSRKILDFVNVAVRDAAEGSENFYQGIQN
jgi:hypothetical protein